MNPIASDWCENIRNRFVERFGHAPDLTPNLINLDPIIQERIMRLGIEAQCLGIDTGDRDQLAIVAHHTLLLDEINTRLNAPHYGLRGVGNAVERSPKPSEQTITA